MVSKLSLIRGQVFALCFFQYAGTHACRQIWSQVSGQVESHKPPLITGFTSSFLSWINFFFLLFYGITVLVAGKLGDSINTKTFLLTGQFATAIVFGSIGLAHNFDQSHRYFVLFMMIINGITQGTGWPGVVTIVDNWFPSQGKLILLGYFAACSNVGNLMADGIFGVEFYSQDIKIYWPILTAALYLILISTLNFIVLKARPDMEKSLIDDPDYQQSIRSEPPGETVNLNFLNVWFVPGVLLYALAFGCVKAVYYILSFWLPQYLDSLTNPVTHTTFIVAMIDVGTIPGGIVVCYIGYYMKKRAIIILPFLLLGTMMMIMINYLKSLPNAFWLYLGLVFLTGFFIGGVYNNIVGGIAAELGRQFKGNKRAVSTVVAAIEGYGSVFAAINQLVVPYLDQYLFVYCGFLSLLTGVCLISFLKKEISESLTKQSREESLMKSSEAEPSSDF